MPSTRRRLIVPTALVALLVGCSGQPAAPSSAPAPAVTSSATPVNASPAPTTGSATSSASTTADCPAGEYTLQSFDVTGVDGSLGKGTGGDVSVDFDNGRYEIDFDDDTPISLTLAGDTGKLVLDGEIKGTYSGSGSSLRFTLGSSNGTARLTHDGTSRTLKMSQVADVLGLHGKGSATCSGADLTLTVGKGTFQLVRDND